MIWYSADISLCIPEQLRLSQRGVQLRHSPVSAERLRQEDARGRLQADRPGGLRGHRLLRELVPGGRVLLRGPERLQHSAYRSPRAEDRSPRQRPLLHRQGADGKREGEGESAIDIIARPTVLPPVRELVR